MKASISKTKGEKELLYTILSVIILLILWKIASIIVDKEILIPSPETTLNETIKIIKSPDFILAVINTLKRALTGFILALGVGISLGMMGGFSKSIYYLLRPLVLISKAVPTMAMILLAIIWLESEKAPILVGFVVIFPVIYENTVQGIRNVDVKLVEMMNIYNVNKIDRLKDLYLPSIRSYLYGGMSATMGLNLKIVIAAEVLSQPRISMGTGLLIEKAYLNTAGVFAWALITIFLAGLLEQTLKIFKRN
ncbi:ABC transporter permease [Desulfitibacter alkalitolerans]|uniref:ABC transporter permease n=1 Tax=Desulfitibacter alkalitolerans TaxID=264641 RepID=UPI000486515B|nr:ABC transporter permease subunit [Desulfitibacter alkalitolerans]